MPFSRANFAAAAIAGSVCVVGDAHPTRRGMWSFTENYCYDPALNKWTLEAPILYTALIALSAIEYDGKVYTFGGRVLSVQNCWEATREGARLTLR